MLVSFLTIFYLSLLLHILLSCSKNDLRSSRKIRIHILFLVKILQCGKSILSFIRKTKDTKIVKIIPKKSKWKSQTSQISKLI